MVTLALSEAGPGRFGRLQSSTDLYHTIPYHTTIPSAGSVQFRDCCGYYVLSSIIILKVQGLCGSVQLNHTCLNPHYYNAGRVTPFGHHGFSATRLLQFSFTRTDGKNSDARCINYHKGRRKSLRKGAPERWPLLCNQHQRRRTQSFKPCTPGRISCWFLFLTFALAFA